MNCACRKNRFGIKVGKSGEVLFGRQGFGLLVRLVDWLLVGDGAWMGLG